jgi:hypothetical protein
MPQWVVDDLELVVQAAAVLRTVTQNARDLYRRRAGARAPRKTAAPPAVRLVPHSVDVGRL